jgi:hypothetical protein
MTSGLQNGTMTSMHERSGVGVLNMIKSESLMISFKGIKLIPGVMFKVQGSAL